MDSSFIELTLASFISLWGIYDFWKRKNHIEKFSSIDLAFWMSALFFGFGPWAAFYYGGGFLSSFEIGPLMEAYFGVLLYMFGLSFSRMFLPRKNVHNFVGGGPENCLKVLGDFVYLIKPRNIFWIYLLVIFVRIYTALTYGLLFNEVNDQRVIDLPYSILIVRSLVDVLGYGCILWSSLFFWKFPSKWSIPIVIFVAEFAFNILQGRREMLFLFIVFGLGFSFSKFKLKQKHFVAFFLVFLSFIFFLFPFFVQIRSFYKPSGSNNGMIEIRNAILEWQKGSQGFQDVYSKNMAERPLIVRFNCQIQEKQKTNDPMMGEAFWTTLIWACPSVIFPQKNELLLDEQTVENHFGLPLVDTSSNWPAYGCADFGWPGGVLAGLLMGLLLSIFERITFWFLKKSIFFAFCSLQIAFELAMRVEAEPTSAWIGMRSIILFVILFKIYTLFRVPKYSSLLKSGLANE